MSVNEQVEKIIHAAIDEANEVRPKHEWIKKQGDEALAGAHGSVDSLALLNLVMSVEERTNAAFAMSLDLSALLAADPGTSPLRTVATFAEHVSALVEAR